MTDRVTLADTLEISRIVYGLWQVEDDAVAFKPESILARGYEVP